MTSKCFLLQLMEAQLMVKTDSQQSINPKEDVTMKLALIRKYSNFTILSFSKYAKPTTAQKNQPTKFFGFTEDQQPDII